MSALIDQERIFERKFVANKFEEREQRERNDSKNQREIEKDKTWMERDRLGGRGKMTRVANINNEEERGEERGEEDGYEGGN